MIHVVGIGPGNAMGRTLDASRALEQAEILVGYTTYIDLLKADYPDKPCFTTPMRSEKDRCLEALRLSREGKRVALCCSGDAQVYGMASLLLELAGETDDIIVVPGVTAALSAAALLGAPLSGDFAVVSLSDLLTPWEVIERRLHGAGAGDFVVALYNPGSRKRTEHLARACDILLQYRPEGTPCGIARNIGRKGQSVCVLSLAELRETAADMFATIIVGNTQTRKQLNRLITPRGYRD